jgi:Relaxase/Mobilisation nuclease domain
MIGLVSTSASFRKSLIYCLGARLTQAEIIHFNQCYGERQELLRQFREVTETNRKVKEPYLRVILALPPQDSLKKSQWVDISLECAMALDFENHQFVAILHKDTPQQHVHLLVNRIGFDATSVRDRYLVPRLCQLCRQTERDYRLTQLQQPRRYQSPEQRLVPRRDQRLARLRDTIMEVLKSACDYAIFKNEMEQRGYKVYRNEKGIAFYHARMVLYQGSLAGYPLSKIELQLRENLTQQLEQKQQLQVEEERRQLPQRLEKPTLEEREEHVQRQQLRMRM